MSNTPYLNKLRNMLAKMPAPTGTFKMPKLPSYRNLRFDCELPDMREVDIDAAKFFEKDPSEMEGFVSEINGYYQQRVDSAIRSKDSKAHELDYLALQRDRYTNLLDQEGVHKMQHRMEAYLRDVDTQHKQDLHEAHGSTIVRYNARLAEIGSHIRRGVSDAEQREQNRLKAMSTNELLAELIKLQKR